MQCVQRTGRPADGDFALFRVCGNSAPHTASCGVVPGQGTELLTSGRSFNPRPFCSYSATCANPSDTRVPLFTNQCQPREAKRKKVNLDISKMPLNTKCIFQSAHIWQHTVLPANKPYLPLLPSRRTLPPFGCMVLILPFHGG